MFYVYFTTIKNTNKGKGLVVSAQRCRKLNKPPKLTWTKTLDNFTRTHQSAEITGQPTRPEWRGCRASAGRDKQISVNIADLEGRQPGTRKKSTARVVGGWLETECARAKESDVPGAANTGGLLFS